MELLKHLSEQFTQLVHYEVEGGRREEIAKKCFASM